MICEIKDIDTHVCSASSLIAYEEYGIKYIGTEKDTYMYTIANERLKEHKSQTTLWNLNIL